MIDTAGARHVIRADAVRESAQPVHIECGDGIQPTAERALSVVPLMEGHVVSGIEVRCSCGSSVVIDCVYDTPGSEQQAIAP